MPGASPPVVAVKVAVVGAGIVGVCAAASLLRDGHDVTLIDWRDPGEGCSFGNAGGICPGSCVPLAMPGTLAKVPGWLLDPEGPLFVRLGHLPRALPWLVRFARAGRLNRVRQISSAMRALHARSLECYAPLLQWAQCEALVQQRGQLHLYETEAELEGDTLGITLRREQGVDVQILGKDELHQLEPALAPIFERAVYLPEQAQCANPFRLVQCLATRFAADGGQILRARVTGFERQPGFVTAFATDAANVRADRFVIAAGAWSGSLSRQLGTRIPLEAERGYHVTVANAGVTPRIQANWARRKFVAAPMEPGLRLAGTDEFAGLDAPADARRAQILLEHGKAMFPGLDTREVTTWMGHRPGTPDSLPVIDTDRRHPNVIYAFGHGHTGLIGASVTGRLVADLVAGRTPAIDLAPYSANRF